MGQFQKFALGVSIIPLLMMTNTVLAQDTANAMTEESAHSPQHCDLNMTLKDMIAYRAPKAKKPYKITYAMVSQAGYFYQATAFGALKAAEEAGVELTLNSGQGFATAAQQITNVRNALARDIDGIVINPTDVNASVAAVEAAVEKGVPVVTMGTLVNTDKATRIVQDDYLQGVVAADKLAELLPDGGAGIVMGGPAIASWAFRRVAGFKDGIAKHPNLRILEVTNQNVDPAEGLVKFNNAVRKYENLDFIYSTYYLLLPPSTVPDRYSSATYIAGGYDPITVESLKEGTAAAILPDFATAAGYLGVAYMVAKLNGEALPPITCMPNAVVTGPDDNVPGQAEQSLYPVGWQIPQ